MLVSEMVPGLELEALMHDAAEAFLGDITRPLKQLLPQYKTIEKNVEAAIFQRLGIGFGHMPQIKAADLRVLAAEQAQIMPEGTNAWAAEARVLPAPITVQFMPPAVVKERFLTRYHELSEAAL